MPKQKTKKILIKKFKITKSGKIFRVHQNIRHRRSHKTKSQIGRYHGKIKVSGILKKIIKSRI